jgi:hypothetical protein
MQDDKTTNLKLNGPKLVASFSRISKSPLNVSHPITLTTGTNEVAMWALQLYIVLFAKFPDPILGASGVCFSIHLQPRDQYPFLYIKTIPGPFFILSPWGAIFSIPLPGTHAHVQNYQITTCMFDYLQILFTSGIWFSCV